MYTFAYNVTMKMTFAHVDEDVITTTFSHVHLYRCTVTNIKLKSNNDVYRQLWLPYIVGCVMNYLSGMYAMHVYLRHNSVNA